MSGTTPPPANGSQSAGGGIRRDMRVLEIIALFPQAADIMAEYGLHCFSCSIGGVESLEDGCAMHGLADEMIDELVDDINRAMVAVPAKPAELIVTAAAAEGIQTIADAEGRTGEILRVIVDTQGGFCMEFASEPELDDLSFFAAEHPHVRVCASPLTLTRIGGATIDFRDGRFKLDLAEKDDCCGKGGCACCA